MANFLVDTLKSLLRGLMDTHRLYMMILLPKLKKPTELHQPVSSFKSQIVTEKLMGVSHIDFIFSGTKWLYSH